ncbi:MAG: hypothetical protein V1896_00765 [Candidatus Zambryskibacteria bacterium]
MIKKILFVIGILAVISVLFFVLKNVSFAPIVETTGEDNIDTMKIDPNVPGQILPLSNDPKDVAWAVFQKYLAYNKAQNLEGVKSVVYKIASVCEDVKNTIDCKARMNLAYQYGSVLKKEDFVNVWSDEKQTILTENFKIQEDDSTIGRTRAIIFFIKDEAGNLRMLSFSPFKGVATDKGTASREELIDRITNYTEDKDEDGLADYTEECIPAETKDTCVPTNPKVRDTDGDGFWDGVEALMK